VNHLGCGFDMEVFACVIHVCVLEIIRH